MTDALIRHATAAPRRESTVGGEAPVVLWCDGAHSPAENMRRDAALLEAAETAAAAGRPLPAVLRVFGFAPAGVTFGAGQDPARTLDLAALEADGVPWAIRPTGGRAIFHAEEWTYSMTAAISDPVWGGTLARACRAIVERITASLQALGIPAYLAAESAGRSLGAEKVSAAACFAAIARHEILVEGRKLAGSAQRRTAHALLQQGSVLVGPGHLRLIDYLLASAERRAAARHALMMASCDAGFHLDGAVDRERWEDALFAELPNRSRRVGEEEGLLTLLEAHSYTWPDFVPGTPRPL